MKLNNILWATGLFLGSMAVSVNSEAQATPENYSRFALDPTLLSTNFLYAAHPLKSRAAMPRYSRFPELDKNEPEDHLYDSTSVFLVYRRAGQDLTDGTQSICVFVANTIADDKIDLNDDVYAVKLTDNRGLNSKATTYSRNKDDIITEHTINYRSVKVKDRPVAEKQFSETMNKILGFIPKLTQRKKAHADPGYTATN